MHQPFLYRCLACLLRYPSIQKETYLDLGAQELTPGKGSTIDDNEDFFKGQGWEE